MLLSSRRGDKKTPKVTFFKWHTETESGNERLTEYVHFTAWRGDGWRLGIFSIYFIPRYYYYIPSLKGKGGEGAAHSPTLCGFPLATHPHSYEGFQFLVEEHQGPPCLFLCCFSYFLVLCGLLVPWGSKEDDIRDFCFFIVFIVYFKAPRYVHSASRCLSCLFYSMCFSLSVWQQGDGQGSVLWPAVSIQ